MMHIIEYRLSLGLAFLQEARLRCAGERLAVLVDCFGFADIPRALCHKAIQRRTSEWSAVLADGSAVAGFVRHHWAQNEHRHYNGERNTFHVYDLHAGLGRIIDS